MQSSFRRSHCSRRRPAGGHAQSAPGIDTDRHRRRHLCGEPQLRQSLRRVSRAPTDCRTSTPANSTQLDRDGSVLKELPPVWGGLTAKGVDAAGHRSADRASAQPAFRDRRSEGLQHAARASPRAISGIASIRTRCRSMAARTTSSPPSPIPAGWSWAITTARSCRCGASRSKYVLADNFFMGAFGGSFLNHFVLVCACMPVYPECRHQPGQGHDRRGRGRRRHADAGADNSPKSAIDGMPKFVNDGTSRPTSMPSTPCSRPISRAPTSRRPTAIRRFADPERADDAAAADDARPSAIC